MPEPLGPREAYNRLLALFSHPDEVVWFVRSLTGGALLVKELPVQAGVAPILRELIPVLERRGWFTSDERLQELTHRIREAEHRAARKMPPMPVAVPLDEEAMYLLRQDLRWSATPDPGARNWRHQIRWFRHFEALQAQRQGREAEGFEILCLIQEVQGRTKNIEASDRYRRLWEADPELFWEIARAAHHPRADGPTTEVAARAAALLAGVRKR